MKKIRIAQIGTSGNSHGNPIWNTLVNHPDLFEIGGFQRRQLVINGTKGTLEL